MLNCAGSREGFFSIGVTRACLCALGNLDEAREALTILVRIGVKTFGSNLTNQVGTGSSTHLLGQRPSKRLISRPVTGVNAVIRQGARMSDKQMCLQ